MNLKGILKTLEYMNDPNWSISLGEDENKIHFRNKHCHAMIDPVTGEDSVHYDEIDPYESPEHLVKHMSQSKKGMKVLQGIVAVGIAYIFGK